MHLFRTMLLLAILAHPAVAAEKHATFSISNMTCALCPLTVKSAISQVPGVNSVEVNQGLGRANVNFDDTRATIDAIAAASTNAGYPAKEIQAQ